MLEKYTTERLIADTLEMSDAAFIRELTNSPGWLQFIGDRNIHSNDDAEKYIYKIQSNPAVNYRVVRLKQGNIPIGLITLIKRDYLEHRDFGFAFLPQFNGQGYATEAASAILLDLAARMPNLLAITLPENLTSIQLLKKLGFTFEKEVDDNGETLMQFAVTADTVFINHLTQSFYQLFTNTDNRKPDLQAIHSYCVPEVLIIKQQAATSELYNLSSFIAPRELLLTDGSLIEFSEKEIAHTTTVKGNIAQRESRYYKTGIFNGEQFQQHGNKFFQYIKTNDGWKVSSIIWEDEVL